jgi:hypothetical protein
MKTTESKDTLITIKSKLSNLGLKNDIELILAEPKNILKIEKGIGKVTNFSIEIWFEEPLAFSSYVYYENETRMNKDFKNLSKIIDDAKASLKI